MNDLDEGLRLGKSLILPRAAALLLAAVMALAALMLAERAATAHNAAGQSPASINADKQLVWRDAGTDWDSWISYGGTQWSNLDGRPNVFREGATGAGAVSLRVYDVYQENITTVGLWDPNPSPDTVTFNDWWMLDYYYNRTAYPGSEGNSRLHIVTTHEFGHALNFLHAFVSDANDDNYYCRNSVMHPNVTQHYDCGGRGNVMAHDVYDWGIRWRGQ